MSLNRMKKKKGWEHLTTGRHFVFRTVRRLAAEVAIQIGGCFIRDEHRQFELFEKRFTVIT
jgi:hypothetical protein